MHNYVRCVTSGTFCVKKTREKRTLKKRFVCVVIVEYSVFTIFFDMFSDIFENK